MKEKTAINVVTGIHSILFVSKTLGGILTGSAAVLSDGLHSGVDVLTAIAINFATRVSHIPADEDHPFGHTRAQSLAAFFVAIMAGIAGIEICKYGIEKLINPTQVSDHLGLIMLMAGMTALSGLISFIMTHTGKKYGNKAMIASGKETIGDVLISLSALIGIAMSYYLGIPWIDPLIAIFIGVLIVKIAYDIAKENIDGLMGAKANDEQISIIQEIIFKNHPKVEAIHDMFTQQLGTKIYVVVHCEIIDENYSFKDVHDIEEDILNTILGLNFVENATVHLDYHDDAKSDRIPRK